MDIKIGSVVKVTAGRDKEKFVVIVNKDKDRYFISDGKNRSILKPKAKNIIHLKKTKSNFNISGETTDKQIRKFLKDFLENE
ncbi:MAG: KOW domain-containing RNA-binding protein [Oscillospiraceae bacterium]